LRRPLLVDGFLERSRNTAWVIRADLGYAILRSLPKNLDAGWGPRYEPGAPDLA